MLATSTAAVKSTLQRARARLDESSSPWFSGRVTCLRYLAHVIGSPGDWLMTPTIANGQPVAVAYYRDGDRTHHALGFAVLTATPAGIARITVFANGPGLVARFGFPNLIMAAWSLYVVPHTNRDFW